MQISRELAEQWASQHGYTDLQYVPGDNPEGGGQWFGFRDSKDMMPLPLPPEFMKWASWKIPERREEPNATVSVLNGTPDFVTIINQELQYALPQKDNSGRPSSGLVHLWREIYPFPSSWQEELLVYRRFLFQAIRALNLCQGTTLKYHSRLIRQDLMKVECSMIFVRRKPEFLEIGDLCYLPHADLSHIQIPIFPETLMEFNSFDPCGTVSISGKLITLERFEVISDGQRFPHYYRRIS